MNSIVRLFFVAACLCVMCQRWSIADTQAEAMQAIAASMRAQWQKPDLLLELPVIVVQEDVAIADWILGEKGGRALLRKQHEIWQTLMCGGSELKFAHRLQQAGVNPSVAETLAQRLRALEASLDAAQRQRIDSFQGVMDFMQVKEHPHAH